MRQQEERMDISGLGSLFGSQELTEIERLRRERESKGALGNLGGGSDTVSISEEGRRLSEEMQARKAKEQKLQEQGESPARDPLAAKAAGISREENGEAGAVPDAPGDAPGGAPGGAAGGAQSGGDSSSQVESIQKQIEQLKAKMQSVASSALPEEVKASTVAAYQAQISELESQKQELLRG